MANQPTQYELENGIGASDFGGGGGGSPWAAMAAPAPSAGGSGLSAVMPIGGAVLGFLQQRDKNRQADQNRLLAAQTQTLSPWTNLQADMSQTGKSNPFISAGQGALSGVAQNQAMHKAQNEDSLAKAQAGFYNRAGFSK